jgi:HNH endonuclease.
MDQNYIKSLSDKELIKSAEVAVDHELKAAQVVIWHLQEIQKRKLYLTMEFADMYECLIGHFKMSDTTAYGRLKVLKIMEDVPEVSEPLRTGDLNISNLALAHSFMEKHHKKTGEELSADDKRELMGNLMNKSTAEAKEYLARCNPDMALPHDEIRPLTATHSQMKSTISKELVKKIEYLKALISHEHINPTHEELLNMALDAVIEKVEKKKCVDQKAEKKVGSVQAVKAENETEEARNPSETRDKKNSKDVIELELKVETNLESTQCLTDGNSRYVSKNIKRFVFNRAQGKCEYVYPSGKRCCSQFQTQFDHVIAFSKGGKATIENMQLLCRVHNFEKGDG